MAIKCVESFEASACLRISMVDILHCRGVCCKVRTQVFGHFDRLKKSACRGDFPDQGLAMRASTWKMGLLY